MNKKPWYKNWIVWLAIILVLGVVGMVMPKSEEQQQMETETQEAIAEAQQATEEAKAKADQAAAEAQAEQERIDNLPTLEELIQKTNETNAPQTAEILLENDKDLKEAIVNNDGEKNILVLKYDLGDGSWNNEATIEKNFLVIEDLVKNHGIGIFDEVQYWATMPLVDSITGESAGDQKVISFTIGNDAMKGITNGVTYATNMKDKPGVLQDLFIHPALQD